MFVMSINNSMVIDHMHNQTAMDVSSPKVLEGSSRDARAICSGPCA
jgi:hypothetical protein